MYCTQCAEACCLACEEHKEHKVEKLDKILHMNAKKCETAAKFVLEESKEIKKQVTGFQKSLREVSSVTALQINAVKAKVEDTNEKISKQGKDLEETIQNRSDELTKSYKEDIKKREDILKALPQIEQFKTGKKPRRKIETLELQHTILQCESDVKDLRHAGSEMAREIPKFVPNSELDVDRLKIGYVQGIVTEDDRSSVTDASATPSFENGIRMLIIGKKKSGRTRTPFALMGHETKPSSRVFKGTFKNQVFSLRRSPGIEKDDIKQFTGPGPHIIILCVKNPDEDVSIVDDYADIFNGDMMKHMIVIFTGKKELLKKKISLEKYVQTVSDESLKRILKSVGGHMIAVNTDDKDSHDAFRNSVFQMASDIVRSNSLRYLPIS